MKQGVIFFLLSSLSTSLLLSSEPSAFGAGDLNSPKPYGLTSNEKVILETKKTLHKVAVKSNNQANKLDSLRDRIDGFQTIIESLSRKAHNNSIEFKKLIQNDKEAQESIKEYNKRVSDIIQLNIQNIEAHEKSLLKLQTITLEMSKLIDTINAEYISKNEFNALVDDVNNFKALMLKELKKSSKKPTSKVKNMSSADLYNQAKKFFDKKYYTDAIKSYQLLIKRKYKPAYAHYMIAEMNFRRKNYANAISYFKKSASLYSKASYMPTLMLHTAISMKNTDDVTHANAFLEALIQKYPDSLEARKAKEYFQQ